MLITQYVRVGKLYNIRKSVSYQQKVSINDRKENVSSVSNAGKNDAACYYKKERSPGG